MDTTNRQEGSDVTRATGQTKSSFGGGGHEVTRRKRSVSSHQANETNNPIYEQQTLRQSQLLTHEILDAIDRAGRWSADNCRRSELATAKRLDLVPLQPSVYVARFKSQINRAKSIAHILNSLFAACSSGGGGGGGGGSGGSANNAQQLTVTSADNIYGSIAILKTVFARNDSVYSVSLAPSARAPAAGENNSPRNATDCVTLLRTEDDNVLVKNQCEAAAVPAAAASRDVKVICSESEQCRIDVTTLTHHSDDIGHWGKAKAKCQDEQFYSWLIPFSVPIFGCTDSTRDVTVR